MGNNLEFILKLTDHFSTAMQAAKNVSDNACTRIANDINKANASSRTMALSVNELRQQLENVNKVRFGTRITNEFNNATRQARELERQIERLESKGQRGGGMGGMVGSFVKGNLIAGGKQRGIGAIGDIAGGSYQKTLQYTGLSNAINSTTKGQGAAAIAQTKSFADKYGINYEASLEGVKTLTGGLMSLNMPLKEQMKIFEGVGKGVAAMGLTADQSKGAMLALGQMASKGTVSAEELRGQLAEKIPGAFGIAAQAMGVTEKKLGEMMQKGEVASKDFLPKFAAQMEKAFGADALKNANGPQAVADRFNNALYNAQTTIGQGLMPLITPMLQVFTSLANTALPQISMVLNQVVNFLSGINTGGSVWSVWIDIIKNVAFAIWATIKSVAGNIWHIVSGVIEWIGKSVLLKDIFFAIGAFAQGIFWFISKIGDAVVWIWDNVISPFLNSLEWVYKTVKGLFGGKTEVQINQTVKTVAPPGAPWSATNAAYIPGMPKADPINLNGDHSSKVDDKDLKGAGIDKGAKSKADNINSGGQRSIVINIGKQIEKLEVHVMSGKEGASEIEEAVREAMRRVFYAANDKVA
jgi:tape measure domain-containing protein